MSCAVQAVGPAPCRRNRGEQVARMFCSNGNRLDGDSYTHAHRQTHTTSRVPRVPLPAVVPFLSRRLPVPWSEVQRGSNRSAPVRGCPEQVSHIVLTFPGRGGRFFFSISSRRFFPVAETVKSHWLVRGELLIDPTVVYN